MNSLDFTVLSKLGSGTFGEVYKVRRVSDNCEYAMKKVKIMDMKEKDKKNTLNQIRILASIQHPHIVQYRQAFFDNNTNHLCIVMELASQGDLAHMIQNRFKRAQGFYQYEIWKYGLQMLLGLKHLHSMDIIHRDLKPANVFFGAKDQLKIGDLNVSRRLQEGLAHTQTGTPNYASPQIWNNDPYSFECDIWSFGCVIYELCCFKSPFRSKNMDELYQKIQSGIYDRIPKRYSLMLQEAISGCLKKKHERIGIDQLIQKFTKYSSNLPRTIKKCNSSVLINTIQFPKDKNDFSHILPSPKYQSSKQVRNPQELIPKRISVQKQLFIDRFLKQKSPIMNQMNERNQKLNNRIYYQNDEKQIRIIRSQKYLPAPNIRQKYESIQKTAEKVLHKQQSFKQILKSLEQARVVNKRIERTNLRRRNLRLAIKF